ncbi:MAG: RHS repeat-associated core domain-containing protein [Chitinophagaceae bacterium]
MQPTVRNLFNQKHHDPFGMLLEGRSWQSTASNKYGFNGKENVDEVYGNDVVVNFGARFYDGRLGRWFSVDSKTFKFTSWTPYHYVTNNPINFIDPNGEDTLRIHVIEVATPFDKDIVLMKITFSLVQIGVEKTVATPPITAVGKNNVEVSTQDYYFMMPREDWYGNNALPEKNYNIRWQLMGQHNDWLNTIFIQPTGRGQFAHPIKTSSESSGCLGPSGYPIQESKEVYDDDTHKLIATYNAYYVGQDKRGTLSYLILENIRYLYNTAERYNETGGKLGFQLIPRSEKTGGRSIEQIELNGVDTIEKTSQDQT